MTQTFISFEEWRKQNADLEATLEGIEDECPECGGDGEHECDCGSIHDCGACDGTGIKGGNIQAQMLAIYESTKKREGSLLSKMVAA